MLYDYKFIENISLSLPQTQGLFILQSYSISLYGKMCLRQMVEAPRWAQVTNSIYISGFTYNQ